MLIRFFMSSLLTLLFPSLATASLDDMGKGEKLVKGCVELTKLYNARQERSFIASRFASSSDVLLAGYCMGVVESYSKYNRCYSDSWYDMAAYIAEQKDLQQRNPSTDHLLKSSCGR